MEEQQILTDWVQAQKETGKKDLKHGPRTFLLIGETEWEATFHLNSSEHNFIIIELKVC